MFSKLFISFEGLDKSGKSTQIELLKERLEEGGLKVHVFHPFDDSCLGEDIRRFWKEDRYSGVGPSAETLLITAAIVQAYEENVVGNDCDVMIADRFFHSTLAYQGYAKDEATVSDVLPVFARIRPDVTIYLDVPVDDTEKRSFGADDKFEAEGIEFKKRVRDGYKELWSDDRFLVINGSQSIEAVHRDIIESGKIPLGV